MISNFYQQILAAADVTAITRLLMSQNLNEDNANSLASLVMFVVGVDIPEQQKQWFVQSAVEYMLNHSGMTLDGFYVFIKTFPFFYQLLFTALMQGRPEITELLLQISGVNHNTDSGVREQILLELDVFNLIKIISNAYMANYTHGRHHDLASSQLSLQHLITLVFSFLSPTLLQQQKDTIMQAAACFVNSDAQQLLPILLQLIGITKAQDVEAAMLVLRNLATKPDIINFDQNASFNSYMCTVFGRLLRKPYGMVSSECLLAAASIAAAANLLRSSYSLRDLANSILDIARLKDSKTAQETMALIVKLTNITLTDLMIAWFDIDNEREVFDFNEITLMQLCRDANNIERIVELLDDSHELISDQGMQNKLHSIIVIMMAIGRMDLARKLITRFNLSIEAISKEEVGQCVVMCFDSDGKERAQQIADTFHLPQLSILVYRLLLACDIQYHNSLSFPDLQMTSDPFKAMLIFLQNYRYGGDFKKPSYELIGELQALDNAVEPIDIHDHEITKPLASIVLMLIKMDRLDLVDNIARKSGLSVADILLSRAPENRYYPQMLVFLFIKLERRELASEIMTKAQLTVGDCLENNLSAVGGDEELFFCEHAFDDDTADLWMSCLDVLFSMPYHVEHKIDINEANQRGIELFAEVCLKRDRLDLVAKVLDFYQPGDLGFLCATEEAMQLYLWDKQQEATQIQHQLQTTVNKGLAHKIIINSLFEKTMFLLINQLASAPDKRLQNTKISQLLARQLGRFKQVIDVSYNASFKNFATDLLSLEAIINQSKQANQPQMIVLDHCQEFTATSRAILIIQPQTEHKHKYDIWYLNPSEGSKMPATVKALLEKLLGKDQALGMVNEIVLPQHKPGPKPDGGAAGGEVMTDEAEIAWEVNAIAAIAQANKEERQAVKQGR